MKKLAEMVFKPKKHAEMCGIYLKYESYFMLIKYRG